MKARKLITIIAIMIGVLFFILISDARQQARFYLGNQGYLYMEENDYESAIGCFEEYLANTPQETSLYWFFFEKANSKDDILERRNVIAALEYCKKIEYESERE